MIILIDKNNQPITDTAFAESLSLLISQRGATQTTFQQKERGQFWATFTPTKAGTVGVRLLLTEQIKGCKKITVINDNEEIVDDFEIPLLVPNLNESIQ